MSIVLPQQKKSLQALNGLLMFIDSNRPPRFNKTKSGGVTSQTIKGVEYWVTGANFVCGDKRKPQYFTRSKPGSKLDEENFRKAVAWRQAACERILKIGADMYLAATGQKTTDPNFPANYTIQDGFVLVPTEDWENYKALIINQLNRVIGK